MSNRATSKKNILSTFSKDCSTFISGSGRNRLRVWGTQEIKDSSESSFKNEFFEPSLTINFSSLAVGEKKTSQGSDSRSKLCSLVACGTAQGLIIVWDINTGGEKWRLGSSTSEGHSLRVTCLAFSSNSTYLYSASRDKTICQWSMDSGKLISSWKSGKNTLTSLRVSPDDSQLISSSATTKVWDLSSKKTLKKMTGHSTSVSCLDVSQDGKYFISGASDRYVLLWDLKSRKREALHNFILDSNPVSIQIDTLQPDSKRYRVLCVSETGKVFIFEYDPKKKSKKTKSSAKCEMSSKSPKHHIIDAQFVSHDTTIVARFDGLQPVFQTVRHIKKGSYVNVDLETLNTGTLLPKSSKSSKKRKTNHAVSVLGPTDIARPDPKQTQQDLNHPKKRRKTEPRLVGIKMHELTQSKGGKTSIPKADSLVEVIVQALKSKDEGLISYIFNIHKHQLVESSVRRLPTVWVVPLLKQLKQKFMANPQKLALTYWIKAVLKVHTSYLLTVPGLDSTLSRVCSIIDTRLAVHNKLLKLYGRLEIITSHVERHKAHETPKPEMVYVEGEDDDFEDAEDVGDKSKSDTEMSRLTNTVQSSVTAVSQLQGEVESEDELMSDPQSAASPSTTRVRSRTTKRLASSQSTKTRGHSNGDGSIAEKLSLRKTQKKDKKEAQIAKMELSQIFLNSVTEPGLQKKVILHKAGKGSEDLPVKMDIEVEESKSTSREGEEDEESGSDAESEDGESDDEEKESSSGSEDESNEEDLESMEDEDDNDNSGGSDVQSSDSRSGREE